MQILQVALVRSLQYIGAIVPDFRHRNPFVEKNLLVITSKLPLDLKFKNLILKHCYVINVHIYYYLYKNIKFNLKQALLNNFFL